MFLYFVEALSFFFSSQARKREEEESEAARRAEEERQREEAKMREAEVCGVYTGKDISTIKFMSPCSCQHVMNV